MKIAIYMLMYLLMSILSSAQKNKQFPVVATNTNSMVAFSNTADLVTGASPGIGMSYGNRKAKENYRTSKYVIYITTMNNNLIKALLHGVIDSTIIIYSKDELNLVQINYSDIRQIKLRKRHALLKGLLIGAGVGISPVLAGSLFGPSIGQGSAYVSVITFPVGIITGGIIGGTSRRKFHINGDPDSFYDFKKQMR